ncbi:MAG TPA: efflux RND transporter periplasmic adaptor subunit [Candidatus Acidoferrales bacterium]|nr:efflux RND transporter periplasmic adaptor subunit [Candidatus Acidoferrales bacterium]
MARSRQNGSDRRRLITVIVIAVAAVLLFTGWMRMRSTVVPVRTEQVTRDDIASVISTNGKVEPEKNFAAHAPAPAIVKRVLVQEGDRVRAGQLLLQLDDADARAQAAKALAQLRAAQADLQGSKSGGTHEEVLTTQADLKKAQAERDDAQRSLDAVQRLQQNGAAAPAEVEAARNRLTKANADVQLLESRLNGRFSSPELAKIEANLNEARAAYSAAEELLKNLNVRAPFSGTVYQLPVRASAYVNGGEILVQVANLEKVRVRAFVDEPEIGRLGVGEKVEISWDAIPGRVWEGTLTRVPASVTMVGTRTVGETTTEIDNFDRKLLPNVNVNVTIITARHSNVLTVSREAVHDLNGKRYVYTIVGDKLRAQEVRIGISSLTRIEITQGLNEGEQIALGAVNAAALRNGMEVKVAQP